MPMSIEGGVLGTWGAYIGDVESRLNVNVRQAVLEEAAQPILEQMRANATGSIREAINTGVGSHKGGEGSGRIGITIGVHRRDWSGEVYYPAYVEYGHGGPHPAPPHPFVRPAIDARADEALDILAERLKQLFGK